MPPEAIRRVLEGLDTELLQALDEARAVDHRGEAGRAREEIVRRFLRRFVPDEFGIDSGFVLDAQGGISNQIDIVIYRTTYHPTIDVGGVKFFMVESVAAVFENKTTIDSRQKLEAALANIRSVKALDRTADGTNYRLDPGKFKEVVSPTEFTDQIFGGVICETGPTRQLVSETLADYSRAHRRTLWPNTVVSLRDYMALYQSLKGERLVTLCNPMTAVRLGLSSADRPLNSPVVHLVAELANWLRVAAFIDFHPSRYFIESAAGTHLIELPRTDEILP